MLYGLLDGIRTLSVIGMCKNAGKTTVLNSVISELEAHNEIIGLTSIGRDGERSDLVTNTKKPEIFVRGGAVIATAEGLLRECDISMEVLDTTGVPTPLGEIVIVRARSAGYVQIGGASITEHQKRIRDSLFAFGCGRVLIDGAISRKSLGNPSLADGVVLSSGASYDPDVKKTAADTAYFAKLFSLPVRKGPDAEPAARYTLVSGDGGTVSAAAFSELVPALKAGAEAIALRGAVTDAAAKEILDHAKLLGQTALIAEDASRLLLKPAAFEKLERFSGGVFVKNGTRVACVTVNPFSAYGMHYDKNEFKGLVEEALLKAGVAVPVMDVKDV
jgi:hypothetical protein